MTPGHSVLTWLPVQLKTPDSGFATVAASLNVDRVLAWQFVVHIGVACWSSLGSDLRDDLLRNKQATGLLFQLTSAFSFTEIAMHTVLQALYVHTLRSLAAAAEGAPDLASI